jgi:hypothetical protein
VAKFREWEHLFRSSTPRDVLPAPTHTYLGVLPPHLAAGVQEDSTWRAALSRGRRGPDDSPLQSQSHQNAAYGCRVFRLVLVTLVRPLH